MSGIGWGNDYIQFKLYHKPIVAGLKLHLGYNKHNFTLLMHIAEQQKDSYRVDV